MIHNKVFISHASSDYRDVNGTVIPGNTISEIIKVLDDNKIARWIDESGLISAKGWCQQIEKAINECNIFLYVSSEKANNSANTANEIAYAIEHRKYIIPFKLDKSPFHKDVRLNLIRIHYLKYYEDRNKALIDLVSTIKNIKTDSVILDIAVKIRKIPDEKKINGELLSERLLSIFRSENIMTASNGFKTMTDILNCKSEKGYEILDKYIQRFKSLAEERNYNVRRSRIERLISDIKEDAQEVERCVSIMIILLKMYLYFCLDDIKEVVVIQKEINDINFDLSFLERNADEINDVSNIAIRGAVFLASAAALLTGRGGSVARGGIYGSTRSGKITVVQTTQEIEVRKKVFETFKKVSQALIFFES